MIRKDIHYINDYGVKLLGYEEHEILGRRTLKPSFQKPNFWTRYETLVHDLLRNPQSYCKARVKTCVETGGEFGVYGRINHLQ